jgi:hypothetical protein
MATHRRPALTVAPPPELLSFDPDEWPAEKWGSHVKLWGEPAMEFVKRHPGTELGSPLTVLREKHRLYEAHRVLEWEASLNGQAP